MQRIGFAFLGWFFLSSQSVHLHAAGTELTTVIARGPHENVIQTVQPDGTTNTFTHLQTGLNRWSGTEYIPASAEVEVVNGVPLARKTQYQVIFGATLDAPEGAVDCLMPDRRRFRVRPQGIAYTEFQSGQPGRSVFVAETKASTPEVTGRSEVTYTDALSGGAGSIRYHVSISGLEQDFLLAGQLPKPSDFQMDEALVRVEVWNEILESPAPERQATAITRKDGSLDRDEELHFGTMLLGSGSAFLVDEAGNQNSVRVARQWQDAEGQVWLI